MRKLYITILASWLLGVAVGTGSAQAAERAQPLIVTIITASDQGEDFDLDNDGYRDQLIELFKFTSYKQVDQQRVYLARSERSKMELPDGYELVLTFQGEDSGRLMLQAVIRKGRAQYMDTVIMLPKPGVTFLGGPRVGEKTLIIVLEMSF
ncbi:MAG: hypothetical protein Q8R76_09930 [Candidatus Omnitrophota bacterium]|nr:hypothetical protein [Candidatus Omnitrophota bacterium]